MKDKETSLGEILLRAIANTDDLFVGEHPSPRITQKNMDINQLVETIMLVAIGDEEWDVRKIIIEDLLRKDYRPTLRNTDSPRLQEFCRVTTLEVKATGSIGAATSLEMIEYIRELERGTAR